MVKEEIRCKHSQRIFDVYDGSHLNIRIKCNNRKCKYKSICEKEESICIGQFDNLPALKYIPRKCPVCGRIVFDASTNSFGKVEIKCTHCNQIVNILIGDAKKPASAA
jgi:phage FluMu protein Com